MASAQSQLRAHRSVANFKSLWELCRLAGPGPVAALRVAVGLTILASLSDMLSLGLLQRGIAGLSTTANHAGTGTRTLAAFFAASLLATGLRLVAQRKTVAAQYAVTRALEVRAFRSLQMQDYEEFLRQGASAAFAALDRLNLICSQALTPFIAVVVALVSVVALMAAVTWLYPPGGFVVAVAFAAALIDPARRNAGAPTEPLSQIVQIRSRLLYEARTAFHDIFLTNGQERVCADFDDVETAFRDRQARTIASAQTARHKVELAGLVVALVVLLSVNLTPGGESGLLPLLAVLALAALRLLPQAAMLHTSLRLVALYGDVTSEVRNLIDRTATNERTIDADPVCLTRELRLEGITLTRADRSSTLRDLSLTVPRGSRIGIRGASGVGKSTLLDVICGAIQPEFGRVLVDGEALDASRGIAWRDRIGVVSQTPVLLGRTLREAVVFPTRPEAADLARFDESIRLAGVAAMVADFPRGLDTPIGEAVSALSGGQCQRLALAHALYRARDLLILDEATGQLDASSEMAIVSVLSMLPRQLTLIVVSHREPLFACCDAVYLLEDGKLSLAT